MKQTEAYLRPYQTTMMTYSCENGQNLLTVFASSIVDLWHGPKEASQDVAKDLRQPICLNLWLDVVNFVIEEISLVKSIGVIFPTESFNEKSLA